MENIKISKEFILSRLQSLMGLAVTFFLFEHLLTNSQIVLFFDDGSRFIKLVNFYQSIPYLKLVEIIFIAIPFLLHILIGIRYLINTDLNSFPSNGKRAQILSSRNIAFSIQRLSAYIIGIILIFHVVEMRFIKYPIKIANSQFLVRLNPNKDLEKAAKRLDIRLIRKNDLNLIKEFEIENIKLKDNKIFAVANTFGKATLISVYNTFQNPFEIFLYSIFVIACAYHAINGLYTFLLSWGVIFSLKHERFFSILACFIALILTLIGLTSIFGNIFFGVK
ncbi:MAG: hypothetical protein A3F40_04565 [Chlamydiae bacterium RIFCSPHIGHO2_12_FULL_27_8]|nr:MAG: hypothetical protein A3F40_04565 [Chlamydiae bacterium RIFCSPHIGHO2_12_FULL_27_8]